MKDGRDDTNFNKLRASTPRKRHKPMQNVGYRKAIDLRGVDERSRTRKSLRGFSVTRFISITRISSKLASERESHSCNGGMISAIYVRARVTIAVASREDTDRHGELIGRSAGRSVGRSASSAPALTLDARAFEARRARCRRELL